MFLEPFQENRDNKSLNTDLRAAPTGCLAYRYEVYAMNLQCDCENISIEWNRMPGVINSRKCGCDYCKRHKGEYVSDSDSEFSYRIFDESKHAVVKHGHGTAEFHECKECGIAFVTCDIDGKYFGIIN